MTRKEREKLNPLIRAADNMAGILEKISEDKEQFTSDGRANITAIKSMTSAMKELTIIIRNLNEIPPKADREASRILREKFELEKKRCEEGDANGEIKLIVESGEEYCE